MNSRSSRNGPSRSGAALIHRGPQAHSASQSTTPTYAPIHAPNAALLIDFDNVTMGIRSDLSKELRTLLGSDIIKGKVAVQRAYADWRRYPQYVVPLAESSIDMIWAPAYGSSKKNATDIRLAVDAMELVFTRPEIGTYILLSGDSDFASLVNKLKEYGKYVIGIGIRESSSDLLVMNCDEYYSYNALAGLVKNSDEEETAKKWDPWELVTEAVTRMKRNGDVMRSDRLKQVMVEIDNSFDEKDLGMAKFSRFVQDATQRGLLSSTKLENGQLEIGLPTAAKPEVRVAESAPADAARTDDAGPKSDDAKREGGRGRRGRRGRGRDREDRPRAAGDVDVTSPPAIDIAPEEEILGPAFTAAPPIIHQRDERPHRGARPARGGRADRPAPPVRSEPAEQIGASGERLTRDEAFDLIRRATAALTKGDESVRAGVVRTKARELLGRDSESLSDRNFPRILKDAHDGDVIDLRRRGDDFEIARAAEAESVSEQLAKTAANNAPPVANTPVAPRGMGPRGVAGPRGRGGRGDAPPANLLIGVVGPAASAMPAPVAAAAPVIEREVAVPAKSNGRKPAAKKSAQKAAVAPAAKSTAKKAAAKKVPAAKKPRAKKAPARAEA